jgi:hypothetical protein
VQLARAFGIAARFRAAGGRPAGAHDSSEQPSCGSFVATQASSQVFVGRARRRAGACTRPRRRRRRGGTGRRRCR